MQCRFCKDEISTGQEFKITEPDREETFFCEECGADMVAYVENGEAEKAKIRGYTNVIDDDPPF